MANNKIQFKRTTISGRTPNTTNSGNTSYIDAGEFAVNLTDQKIYSSNGTVSFEVGANLTSLAVSTITAGNTTVTGDLTVNNYVIAANGATSAYATKYLVEYNPTTKDLTYSSKPDASRPYITGYGQEIHVSPVALDDTGNGTIGDPVKTIAQALVLAAAAFETTSAGERKTIILHPGDYAANVTIDTQYLVLSTHELIGKNTTLSGTLTINKGCTVEGLKMTNLVIAANSSVGTVDIVGCTVSTATTKTAGAYTVFRACDLSSSTLNITGGGSVVMVGGNYGNVTVANTSAGVLAKAIVTMGPTTLTSGTLQISDTLVYAASNTASAITQSAGSILTLNNSQTLIPDLSNVARNTFGGFYSILHSVYDKTNSTFGGTSLAAIDHSQHLNIDKLIVGNTTVNVAITSTAITSNATLAVGNTTVTGFANVSSTLQVGGNVVLSSTTGISANGSVGSAGQGLVSNGSAVYWSNNAGYTGSAGFTGSQGATGFTGSKGTTTIANTAPASPVNGDTWWNSETGVRYVYYADGTSNQWVQESAAGPQGPIGFTGSSGGGSVGGSNTQVIFNDSGSANGSSSFTFNKTTTTLAVGSNVTVNTSTIFVGNSTVNTTIIAGNVNLQGTQLKVGNVVVNGNQLVIGNVTITDTQITVGNSTVNTVLSSTGSLSGIKTLAAGNTSITGFANVSTSVNSALLTVGTSFIANTTGAYHTGTMNAASHTVGTSFIANTTQVTIAAGVKLSANGGVGTAGQVLSSNGSTGSPYWATVAGGGGGVTTFDGGSTGLSPYSASNGAVSLGGTLNVGYGGTGTSTYPSNGQLLIGTSGGGYAVANLTAGSGVSITKGSGTITIAATGGGGGGPYIAFFQFEPSGGTYIGNGPTYPTQQSPVVYWDSGLNQASLWWYYPTGSVSNNGVSINGGITVQDNSGSYTFYTSGTDFSSSVSNWYGSGNVIGIYGLGVTNVTLRALMANTAAQLGSPAIAPRGTNMFGSQSTIYASVSGGINSSYSSGGRPIIVTPGYSNGYYGIYFNSGSPTSDSGLSLSYLTIDNNLGTGSYTYYAGTDFSVSSAGNDSNQQFSCQIYSVSNTTLSTLLNNTIIN